MSVDAVDDELTRGAHQVADLLAGRSLACAESCTAGLVAQTFAAVEGSGDWFRGGIIAYQRQAKVALLDVRPDEPLVSETVAEHMARAAARRFGADVAVATTGAAGPDPLDGAPPGTVVVGVLIQGAFTAIRSVHMDAEPADVVRRAAIDAMNGVAVALSSGDAPTLTPC
jgi:nicotinamide-nucleotide amidase